MVALITATNVAYNERERRGFFRRLFLSLVLTVGAVLALIAVVLLGIALPLVLHLLPLGNMANAVLLTVRWVLLWTIVVVGLSTIYHFAPNRAEPKWRWVSWGAAIAATLWILSSIGFAVYVRQASSYGETYGALGGVVIMLMWFYISGFVVILGAEINSEMERQTVKDTTDGVPKPIGERGAFSADTVGPQAGAAS
jgi:membrane protein